MKYVLDITQKAIEDLRQTSIYIATELHNPDAARDLLDKAESAAHAIPKYPKKHPVVRDPFLAYFEVRFVVVKNYLLFFTVDEGEKTVHVIRFLYSKSDWKRILQDDFESRKPPQK